MCEFKTVSLTCQNCQTLKYKIFHIALCMSSNLIENEIRPQNCIIFSYLYIVIKSLFLHLFKISVMWTRKGGGGKKKEKSSSQKLMSRNQISMSCCSALLINSWTNIKQKNKYKLDFVTFKLVIVWDTFVTFC